MDTNKEDMKSHENRAVPKSLGPTQVALGSRRTFLGWATVCFWILLICFSWLGAISKRFFQNPDQISVRGFVLEAEVEVTFDEDRIKETSPGSGDIDTDEGDAKPEALSDGKRHALVVFLHVHKAGGSSACSAARYNDEVSSRGNCNTAGKAVSQGSAERLSDLYDQLIASRGMTFIASEWMLSDTLPKRSDVTYVTMLRNPLGRTESHYAMAMGQAQQRMKRDGAKWRCRYANGIPSEKELASQDEDLEIASRARIYFAQTTPDNWQTRALCGPPCAPIPFGKLTEEHLNLAKRRLADDYDVVGILEHFNETMRLMHKHRHWEKEAEEVLGRHKGTHHGGLSVLERVEQEASSEPHLLEFAKWFHATNQFDIELYNLGLELFHAQARARGVAVDLRPDVSLDFESPTHGITTSSELRSMLANFVEENKCGTQCCSGRCGPIGFYWYRTAENLNMVPARKGCTSRARPAAQNSGETSS
ncbi:Hypothetical Protein FCC1311_017482 [Hondaea fermentalgiana]|uniref:Uncharacterized protein n=1 Tax=Hondaea fermentalgiana TaxID=2315210 RepID=A0A2R5G5A3_9STRA|nr:Hypothetical Protein FCC1311_017482 [Hondaea fermentalgiana]|eukprot:GBG25529.1 Hypothetical Protein FCC1311_017482 [Hondaea fermentalgiana]